MQVKAGNRTTFYVEFEHNARVMHVNFGPWMDNDGDQLPGFTLCRACGEWMSLAERDAHLGLPNSSGKPSDPKHRCTKGAKDRDVDSSLALFVETPHDVLTFRAVREDSSLEPKGFGETLIYALREGIALTLDLDDSELGGFLAPAAKDAPNTVVIYESSQGGTGTLEAILDDQGATLRGAAQRALELLHFDEAGADVDGACEAACYDCLCTFYNQRVHPLLDRRLVLDQLLALAATTGIEGAEAADRYDKFLAECANENERIVLRTIRKAGLRLPDYMHHPISIDGVPVLEADLFYGPLDIVLIDGSVHYVKYVKAMDDRKRAAVKSAGYRVTPVKPKEGMDIVQALGSVAK